MLTLTLLLVFVSISLCFWVFLTIRPSVSEPAAEAEGGVLGSVRRFTRFMDPFNRKIPLTAYKQRVRQKLVMAGEPYGMTADDFIGLKEAAVGIGIVLWLVFGLVSGRFSLAWLLVLTGIGFFTPDLKLRDIVKKRHTEILKAFPFFLDLLTLSVEAGLDFGAGIKNVVEKSRPSALRQELERLAHEIRMGKTRREAVRDMAERINLLEMSMFASGLIQADQLGTSLGPMLRVQADQMRTRRFQRAEKMAAEAPLKILGPLIICIFPTVFIILFVPIIMKFFKSGAVGMIAQ